MLTGIHRGIVLVAVAIGSVGCAAKSTGVFRINESDYGITVAEKLVEAQKLAYEGAKEECSKQGKDVFTIRFDKAPNVYSAYELTFRCTGEYTDKTH